MALRGKAAAWRASWVMASQSFAAIAALGVNQDPPTQTTLGSARKSAAVSTVTPTPATARALIRIRCQSHV